MNTVGPAVTLLVGLVAAFIAWQQWALARGKLRLDLFDRRYKVYDATRTFLVEILTHAKFEDKHLWEFHAGTSDAEFLFGRDVVDYLKEIRERALDMKMHQRIFNPLPVGAERSQHVDAEHTQLVWLTDQLTKMNNVFSPYLSFATVR